MTCIETNHQLLTQFVDNTTKQAENRVEISFSADTKFLAHFDACNDVFDMIHSRTDAIRTYSEWSFPTLSYWRTYAQIDGNTSSISVEEGYICLKTMPLLSECNYGHTRCLRRQRQTAGWGPYRYSWERLEMYNVLVCYSHDWNTSRLYKLIMASPML